MHTDIEPIEMAKWKSRKCHGWQGKNKIIQKTFENLLESDMNIESTNRDSSWPTGLQLFRAGHLIKHLETRRNLCFITLEGSARWNAGDSGHLWNLKAGGRPQVRLNLPFTCGFCPVRGMKQTLGSSIVPVWSQCQFMSIFHQFLQVTLWASHHELLLENAAHLDPISEISCLFLTEMGFSMFFYRTISPLKPIQ